jgi:hypothetical protein
VDRRPQEGTHHQRGRKEHVAGQHRGQAQGGGSADRSGLHRRRSPPVHRRAAGARPPEAGLDAKDRATVAAVQREVDIANAQLSRVEPIKRFMLLPDEWLPGGDELTPTMKLKRRPIIEKYAAEIEVLYG